MEILIKRLIICLAFGLLFIAGGAQTFSDISYGPADSIITNPERGFYKYSEIWASSGTYYTLDLSTLQSWRQQGYTLIYRIYYLDLYKSGDIAPEFIDNINNDFEVLRKAGMKVVLRFAYTVKTSYPVGDAPVNVVLRHIEQLKPLLQQNADVIMTLQAGFIGAWGEWYYTDYYAFPSDSANWSLRAKIVASEMDALPKSRMVQLRTVPYLYKLAADTVPLTEQEAYSGSFKARLAHHNDCFVADQSNYGTYSNLNKDRSYLSRQSQYTVIGGETCNVFSPYSDCPNSVNDLATMHWTFLNIDYNNAVLNGWKTQGCMDDIWKKLGYRYRLVKTRMQDSAKSNGSFSATIQMINDGYSNPVNPRRVELILKNAQSGDEYYFKYGNDIRLAKITDTVKLDFLAGLPGDMPEGAYDLYLNLPDPEVRLYNNPLYSIRVANDNAWDSQSGYNKLGATLTIKNLSGLPDYSGSDYFLPRSKSTISARPSPLKTDNFSNNVLIYWGANDRQYYQSLERSKSGGKFEPIATLYPGITSYIDKNLTGNTHYIYRLQLINNNSCSPYDSIEVVSNPSSRYFIRISSDDSLDDWSAVPPAAVVFLNDTTSDVRITNSLDSIFILYEGMNHPQLFFCTADTGIAVTRFAAYRFTYMISNDTLYDAAFNAWKFKDKIKCVVHSQGIKYAVPLAELPIYKNKTDCLLGVHTASCTLPDTLLALIRKVSFPRSPQNFIVTNNPYFPNTSLYISWNSVTGATSYIVERSDGNASGFVFNQEVAANDNRGPHIDLNLDYNTTYFYRVCTVNNLYRSSFSDTAFGKPFALGVENDKIPEILVYPNPVEIDKLLKVDWPGQDKFRVVVYNELGKEMYSKETFNGEILLMPSEAKLAKGIYFISVSGNTSKKMMKLVVN